MVCPGRVQAANEFQSLEPVIKMAENVVAEDARIVSRFQDIESNHLVVAGSLEHAFKSAESSQKHLSEVIERAFDPPADAVDRTIPSMWLNGFEHAAVAVATRLSNEAVRLCWYRFRGRVREVLAPTLETAA